LCFGPLPSNRADSGGHRGRGGPGGPNPGGAQKLIFSGKTVWTGLGRRRGGTPGVSPQKKGKKKKPLFPPRVFDFSPREKKKTFGNTAPGPPRKRVGFDQPRGGPDGLLAPPTPPPPPHPGFPGPRGPLGGPKGPKKTRGGVQGDPWKGWPAATTQGGVFCFCCGKPQEPKTRARQAGGGGPGILLPDRGGGNLGLLGRATGGGGGGGPFGLFTFKAPHGWVCREPGTEGGNIRQGWGRGGGPHPNGPPVPQRHQPDDNPTAAPAGGPAEKKKIP